MRYPIGHWRRRQEESLLCFDSMKNQDSKVFYPTDNDKIPMRTIHTKDQVEEIVEHINEIEPNLDRQQKTRENISIKK